MNRIRTFATWLSLVALIVSAECLAQAPEATETVNEATAAATTVLPEPARRFSYGYWPNGWRKTPKDTSPDVLCFETGHYGFLLDMDDLTSPRFGLFNDRVDYVGALNAGRARIDTLQPAELAIELVVDGKTYQATTCRAGVDTDVQRLKNANLWWSGRFAQHYIVHDLVFTDETGKQFACFGKLDLVAWPGSLTLTTELEPALQFADGPDRGASGNGHCIINTPLQIPHSPELDPATFTAEIWMQMPKGLERNMNGWMLCKNDNEWGQGNFGLVYNNGMVAAVMNNAGGQLNQVRIPQYGPLKPGRWYHYAIAYDGTTMEFYVDGERHGSKKLGAPRTPGTGALRIGQRADGELAVIHGLYDQLRIWNRVLSQDELKAHLRAPGIIPDKQGLLFERNFDSGAEFKVPSWTNAQVNLRFKTAEREWKASQPIDGAWEAGQPKQLTLTCDLDASCASDRQVSGTVTTPGGQTFPIRFDATSNCYVADIIDLERRFEVGYIKITNYDEFNIQLDCADDATRPLPFLLRMYESANDTAMVPILCHPDGTPSGIPVQLSKNWHDPPMGNGLRAFTLLPLKKGANRYRLRVPYTFYGNLPTASHAQLSLVGWGGNGRWDQLALSSGGESITFDIDMSPTEVAVCDIRLPLARNGKDGNPWTWSDVGWGGDWLGLYHGNHKIPNAGMKAAYLSHGPCLTDVLYQGTYGADGKALLSARVQTPRTNDYARTFQKLEYQFQQKVSTKNSYLMKKHADCFDTTVAYGNANGLIAEKRIEGKTKRGDLLIPPTEITGPGPWWVAFPGRTRRDADMAGRDWAIGYISWVIRDYHATFGSTDYPNPHFQVKIEKRIGNEATLETLLVPPPVVKSYQPGDRVLLDTQWLHLHRNADRYGGSNEAYREHLAQHPQSWRTTYREVSGNNLDIDVVGGELLQQFPIMVRATADIVQVTITGGIGYVPIQFEGLASPDGYALYDKAANGETKLDQSVRGNDFWQTDHDLTTNTYRMTYNVPLDGRTNSTWILKQQ